MIWENLSLLWRPHPIQTFCIWLFSYFAWQISLDRLSFTSRLVPPRIGDWEFLSCLFFIFIPTLFERLLYIFPFFFFLAMEWQLRSPNGSHICCRLHRFVVCLTIFFFFFSPFGSLIFLFIAFRTCAFISHKQTNKHDGGGGVVAKQKSIIFPI